MTLFTYSDYLRYKEYFAKSYNTLEETNKPYTIISKESNINDIHDKLYRDLLNHKKEFSLFLKYFLDYDIPATSLVKYNSTFITNDFKNKHSDIVYKIKGQSTYIFLEHQSSIDYSMPYRIFEYYTCLLRDTIDFAKLKHREYKMPSILPILLYTGNKTWNLIPNIQEKQETNIFHKGNININYDFVNIHHYTNKNLIASNSTVGYVMATDRCMNRKELISLLDILSSVITDDTSKQFMQRIIFFIFDRLFDKKVKSELIKKFNERNDATMKTNWEYIIEDVEKWAEKTRNSAIRKGLREGKKEGRIEGEKKGIFEITKNMIKNGENADKIALYTGFSKTKIEKIKREMNLSRL